MSLSFFIAAFVGLQYAAAIPMDAIASKQSTPIAPRGGVLMVQLVSEKLGDNWPSVIDVTFDTGMSATGHVGWIEKNMNSISWTSNSSTIRPIRPTDNTRHIHPLDAMTGPVLLVELPASGNGPIQFGEATIDPTWVALPSSLPNLNIFPTKVDESLVLSGDDKPEWNALEYWRWTLVASRFGVQPPAPPDTSVVERLSALYGAQLWRIGFDTLSRSSRGVAAACRDLLTNIACDNSQKFACWIVQPELLTRLLSIMTDQYASSRQITSRALRWVEQQQPFILWLEGVYGDQVTVAMTNPTLEPSLATIMWKENDEFPIVIELPAANTVRSKVRRVAPVDLSIFGPKTLGSTLQWLNFQIGSQKYVLPIVSSKVTVLPPNTMLPQLQPVWNLRSMQQGFPLLVQKNKSTSVQVRKLLGTWELFIQCNGNSSNTTIPSDTEKPEDVIGVEAITIIHSETDAIMSIPPSGVFVGINIPSDTKVISSSGKRSWNIRIELPSEWISNDQLSFSVVRTHGDSLQVETAPLPCVPWDINPLPIVLDLSEWDIVKSIPATRRN